MERRERRDGEEETGRELCAVHVRLSLQRRSSSRCRRSNHRCSPRARVQRVYWARIHENEIQSTHSFSPGSRTPVLLQTRQPGVALLFTASAVMSLEENSHRLPLSRSQPCTARVAFISIRCAGGTLAKASIAPALTSADLTTSILSVAFALCTALSRAAWKTPSR